MSTARAECVDYTCFRHAVIAWILNFRIFDFIFRRLVAAGGGHYSVAKFLLEHGAHTDTVDRAVHTLGTKAI